MNKSFWILVLSLIATTSNGQKPPDKNYLLGKFNPQTDARFSVLKSEHAQTGGVLRTEAYQAFIRMAYAANKEKVKLSIISATRNFISQKRIWEGKWKGTTKVEGKDLTTVTDLVERAKIVLHYSAMPGTSRHHWGTEVDLNSLENGYFETGEGLRIYSWLVKHAVEYGFCQVYTSKKTSRTGYEEEKWHWSYMPLAKGFLEEYNLQILPEDIQGFEGSEIVGTVQIVPDYVNGIACKDFK